jgi:hypothetical protein
MDKLSEISLLLANWKSTLAGSAFVADAAAEISNYENVGTKGILILAIIYLVRQREADRVDARAREDKLNATINANTEALHGLKHETEKQTQYHEHIVKAIVDDNLKDRRSDA